jgi:hypothetical protein
MYVWMDGWMDGCPASQMHVYMFAYLSMYTISICLHTHTQTHTTHIHMPHTCSCTYTHTHTHTPLTPRSHTHTPLTHSHPAHTLTHTNTHLRRNCGQHEPPLNPRNRGRRTGAASPPRGCRGRCEHGHSTRSLQTPPFPTVFVCVCICVCVCVEPHVFLVFSPNS